MRQQIERPGPDAVLTVVSGGQTGVDRAALDAAMGSGTPVTGWCPRGRRAEDGPIDARYPLRECIDSSYRTRTEMNVRDSDATMVLYRGTYGGGTTLAVNHARALGRPILRVDLVAESETAAAHWLAENGVGVLHVAGPRESEDPGIYEVACQWITGLLGLIQ